MSKGKFECEALSAVMPSVLAFVSPSIFGTEQLDSIRRYVL